MSSNLIHKTIVVFANSRKSGEHCVAGKCLSSGAWIRPVSNELGGALSRKQVNYANKYGQYLVKPLQKIEMAFESHAPLINQPENYIITDKIWRQRFKIQESELTKFLDRPDSLWGVEDRVSYQKIRQNLIHIQQSLFLVQVSNFQLVIPDKGSCRAKFTYSKYSYNLAITDPYIQEKSISGIPLNPILCISLGKEFNGFCYKLVANVFLEAK